MSRDQRKDRNEGWRGMRWAQSTSELRISLQCTWIPLSSLGCTYMSPSLHRLFLGCWWLATAAIFRAYVVSWALLLAHLRASLFPPGGNTDIAKTKCSGVKDHQLECFWLKTCCQAIYFPTVFFFFFFSMFSVMREGAAYRTSASLLAEVGNA